MRGLALLALALAGCSCARTPHPVVHGTPLRPVSATPIVRYLWAQMELCVGRIGEVGRWRWYVVDAPTFATAQYPLRQLLGFTDRPGRRIYLTADASVDVGIVRHEILHALGIWHAPVFDYCKASPSELVPFVMAP